MPTSPRSAARPWLPQVAASAALIVMFMSVLPIPLAAADNMGLSDRERVGWLMAAYGVPGLLMVVLSARRKQPLMATCNIFLLIYVASLGSQFSWAELVGATIAAGGVVLILGAFGVVGWISRWIPAPIVQGVLAGAVVHFFVDLFDAVGDAPLIVGVTLLVYLASRRLLEPRVPALLPAISAGVLLVLLRGEFAALPASIELVPAFVTPQLSLSAMLTVTPVIVVLITVQANVPSIVLLRRQGYDPPDSLINTTSGIGTAVASLLGPVGVSLSLPATALCAGPEAGDLRDRYRTAYVAGVTSMLVGAGAGLAAAVVGALPRSLLLAFVGLAVIGVIASALHSVTSSPLTLGPLFAFGIAQSNLELAGLGPFFWALAGGLAVSALLERDGWRHLPAAEGEAAAGAGRPLTPAPTRTAP